MGKYYFYSTTKDCLRNFYKTLGFALFFERHERHMPARHLCKRLQIEERELDDIELGRGTLHFRVLRKLLEFYGQKIELRLFTPGENEHERAIPEELWEEGMKKRK